MLLEKFIEALKKKRAVVHNCSFCDYACGYYASEAGKVFYDSGCDCVNYSGIREVTRAEISDFVVTNRLLVERFLEG